VAAGQPAQDAVAAAPESPAEESAAPAAADQRVGVIAEAAPTVPSPAPAVSAGELVEYCLPDGYSLGEWRPALLITEWQPGYWSLAVFADGGNDGLPCPWWVPTVLFGDGPGHWRRVMSDEW